MIIRQSVYFARRGREKMSEQMLNSCQQLLRVHA